MSLGIYHLYRTQKPGHYGEACPGFLNYNTTIIVKPIINSQPAVSYISAGQSTAPLSRLWHIRQVPPDNSGTVCLPDESAGNWKTLNHQDRIRPEKPYLL